MRGSFEYWNYFKIPGNILKFAIKEVEIIKNRTIIIIIIRNWNAKNIRICMKIGIFLMISHPGFDEIILIQ